MKRILTFCLILGLGAALFTGCAGKGKEHSGPVGTTSKKSNVYALVAKDINNPYMKSMYDGFEKACNEIGVEALYRGPDQATPEKQIEVINQLVSQKVGVIAVAANDVDALQPALTRAMKDGIKVISLDSAVNKNSRAFHIQQADPEKIGRTLIRAAHEMVHGDGGIAILSATPQATNQNLWIKWMKKELEEYPDKYKKTPLVTTVYGDDDPTKSTSETNALLTDKRIKVIIAPTTVGMLAAGKVLQNKNSDVLLTGLGLPSEMEPFITSGVCPWMYLWNPIDIGYLAAYAGNALAKAKVTGLVGDTFEAGRLGNKSLTMAEDAGTEVMLGEPFKFDKSNIEQWKNVY